MCALRLLLHIMLSLSPAGHVAAAAETRIYIGPRDRGYIYTRGAVKGTAAAARERGWVFTKCALGMSGRKCIYIYREQGFF